RRRPDRRLVPGRAWTDSRRRAIWPEGNGQERPPLRHLPSGRRRRTSRKRVTRRTTEGYILRQLQDFKNDLRHSSDPRKGNSNTMVMLAKGMSDDEMKESARYFASVAWRLHVKVVETRLVPKTKIHGELFIPQSNKLTEPIGNRIIE